MKWEIVDTKSGLKNICFIEDGKRVCLYSRINPELSGKLFFKRNFKGKGYYVIIGAGLLYHIKPFIDKREIEKIIIIEPFEGVLRLAEKYNERLYKSLREDTRVRFIVGKEEIDKYISSIRYNYQLLFYKSINILIIPALKGFYNSSYGQIKERIENVLNLLIDNAVTIASFARKWLYNFASNYRHVLKSTYDFYYLKNIYSGSCIVAAAGPTLSKLIEEVLLKKKDIFIISVDAAVRPLVMSGIFPDMVVSIDPQSYIRIHFAKIEKELKGITGILQLMSHPSLYDLFEERYLYTTGHPLNRIVYGINESYEIFDFVSVSNLALRIAIYLGFENIYLAGFDFSFLNYMPYVRGSFWDYYGVLSSNRLKTLLTTDINYISEKIEDKRLSTSSFIRYKNELEELIMRFSDKNFFRIFPSNVEIVGTRAIDFLPDVSYLRKIDNVKYSWIKIDKKDFIDRFYKVKDEVLLTLALYYRIKRGLKRDDAFSKAERDMERLKRIIISN